MVITSAIVPKRFYNKTVKQKATVEAANETSMGSLRLEVKNPSKVKGVLIQNTKKTYY
jgi:hypothetical protein